MVLLVTGSTGIAAATADVARSHGATVFVVSLDAPADAVGDLADPLVADNAVAACVERHGGLDALLACAGASGRSWGDGPADQCTDEGWRRTLDANLDTAFHTCRAALRHMLTRSAGSIVTVGSVLARSPQAPGFSTHAYIAAKGALHALSGAMAAHYAPRGIRVNHLEPGLVRTPMTRRAQSDPALLDFMKRKQPLTRGMLEPDEVARAAWFLLSDESRAITGATLTVDGGWSIS